MDGCCGPSTCFTCNDKPKSKDACMCGCGYLNGMWTIFTAQFFTLIGAILSLATLGDCSFASIDTVTFDLSGGEGGLSKESRGVGFITFQTTDGHCYWYNENSSNGPNSYQLQAYWNMLGAEWETGMILTWVCAVFSWYFFLYTISFCCSAQIKCCRYLNGFCLSVVLVILQACTFIAYTSEFCDKYNCSFSRTAGYSIGAIACYIIAGIAFFLSSDYPGTLYDDEDRDGQDFTNAVVYHEDPKLNPTEYAEARRISQQLGGTGTGASVVSSPAV